MLWLATHFPLLPLEVFQGQIPQHEAFAVIQGNASPGSVKNNHVLMTNKAASEKGIDVNMSESTALALCHNITLASREIDRELKLLNQLAETAYRFSSQVIVYTTLQNQHSLVIEISRSIKLFGGLEKLKQGIKNSFSSHPLANPTEDRAGFTVQLALEKSPQLSELLARHKYMLASSQSQHTQHKTEQQEIPIEQLDCRHQDKQSCINMGIRHIAQLLELPREALGRRFNQAFVQYLNYLDGRATDQLITFKPATYFEQEIFYTYGLRSHNDLQTPMTQLVNSLVDYLRFRQLQCTSIQWRFVRLSKKSQIIGVHFSKPQIDPQQMLGLSQLQLMQLEMDSPVECVQLKADAFIPLHSPSTHRQTTTRHKNGSRLQSNTASSGSGDIFGDGHIQTPHYEDPLLLQDAIHAKLGKDALKFLHIADRHLPEQANQVRTIKPGYNKERLLFARQQKKSTKKNLITDTGQTNNPKPSEHHAKTNQPKWMIEPPKPIDIQVKTNGRWLNNQYKIDILKGPDRINSHWWQKPNIRDYFIVGCFKPNGSAHYHAIYWVFKDKVRNEWFLQGIF